MLRIRTLQGTPCRGRIPGCYGGFGRLADRSNCIGIVHTGQPWTIGTYAMTIGVGQRLAVRMPAGA